MHRQLINALGLPMIEVVLDHWNDKVFEKFFFYEFIYYKIKSAKKFQEIHIFISTKDFKDENAVLEKIITKCLAKDIVVQKVRIIKEPGDVQWDDLSLSLDTSADENRGKKKGK